MKIKNSVHREDHKVLLIRNTKIPSIAKFLNSVDREDQKVPSIANTKNPVDHKYKNFLDRKARRSWEIRKSWLHFSYEKQI